MTEPSTRRPPLRRLLRQSLQVRLGLAFSAVTLLTAAVAGSIAFYDTYRETLAWQDDVLRQTAAYINPQIPAPVLPDQDNDARIFIQTPATPADGEQPLVQTASGTGFDTREIDGDRYRVYIHPTAHGAVAVMQETEYREDLAQRAAINSALPLLLLVPLLGLLGMVIMYRALRPLWQLSQQLDRRQDADLTPLSNAQLPSEIHGFVSAINRMLAKTEAAMQQQQRFIADAAHELRSPMTALSLQAERLAQHPLPPETAERLQQLQHGIRRNRELLAQLLSLARSQAGSHGQQQHLNTTDLLRRVIETLLPLAEAKQQEIGVTDDAGISLVADSGELETLLQNLADNAIRYSPPGSRIDLAARRQDDWLVLSVEDNGPGIDAEQRQRVCDPFYRIPGSGEDGTGLGLAIADTIVRRYGGRLVLQHSRQFTHGLLVEVHWPLPASKCA